MESSEPVVALSGLTKSYGDFVAVKDLAVDVARGERFALLGPNGAGKTTTIRMMMGILQPDSGSARILDMDCFSERAKVMAHVGYLPDEPIFYDYLRGSEVLAFVREMRGMTGSDAVRSQAGWVERFGLEKDLEEYAVNYSKGMKKKLAIICALMHDPQLLILDEPTNGLDPFATRLFHEVIRERTERGSSVFFSTHLLDQAERLCDRVAIMYKGRIVACGALDELRENLAPGGTLEEIFFSVARESEPS